MVAEVKLTEIIESALKVLDLELVGCEMHSQSGRSLLRIYIENEKGVSIDDCERASRQISALLDVEDPFSGQYNLEVSSPGLNRPLFKKEHYERFCTKRVKIRLHALREGRRNFEGIIKAVEGDNVLVVVDDETFELPIDEIEKANLVPEF